MLGPLASCQRTESHTLSPGKEMKRRGKKAIKVTEEQLRGVTSGEQDNKELQSVCENTRLSSHCLEAKILKITFSSICRS